MMLGARTAAWAKSGGVVPTARDYVQDGLIAMWDGIEGEWKNIVGNHEQMEFVGSYQLRSDCVYIDGVSGAYGVVRGLSLGGNPTTQEFVLKIEGRENYGRVIAENTGLCTSEFNFNRYRLFGFGIDTNVTAIDSISGERQSVSLGIGTSIVEHFFVDGVSMKRADTLAVNHSSYPTTITFFNRAHVDRGIKGELCCVRIYNRVISTSEIAANYAVDKVRFNLPETT